MAKRRDDDIESLLAEVDQSLSGKASARPVAPRGASSVARPERGDTWRTALARRVRIAAVGAAVAAVVVFVAFFFTPLLGAVSGAAGAALATFVVLLVVPPRRR